ncbi:MAG: hypothetical protein DRJ97_00830 [Thermoprotei archaeon]|nr:MAG: hypothetical protein DRJ97_00830 [Thermoprotei archaeon]
MPAQLDLNALSRELRRAGFYVRRHSYEYLVAKGDGEGFAYVILMEPKLEKLHLICMDDKDLVIVLSVLKTLYPDFKVALTSTSPK